MESKNFSIKEALDFGWRKTKENLGFFIALLLSYVIIFLIFGTLLFWMIILPIIWLTIYVIWFSALASTFTKVYLNFYDGIENDLSLFFSDSFRVSRKYWFPGKDFYKYFLAASLVGVIVGFWNVLGSVLFFLINNWVGKIFSLFLSSFLGLSFVVRLQFFHYFIADEKSGPLESLKNSWNITKGVVGKIFLLNLTLVLINILGVLLFIVGSLVTIPVSGLALAFVYRKLSGQHELSSNALPNNQ